VTEVKLGTGRAPESFGVFSDHEADWAFKRTLAYLNEKAAEIGEWLYVARRIDEKDGESWIREWSRLGARLESRARDSLSSGHETSAREAFLRAAKLLPDGGVRDPTFPFTLSRALAEERGLLP